MEEKREGNKKVRSGFMEEKCPGEEILPGCQGREGACCHIHLSIAGRLDRQVPALSSFAARDFEKGKAPCSGHSSTGRNVADSPTIRHVSCSLYHLIVPLSGRFSVLCVLCFIKEATDCIVWLVSLFILEDCIGSAHIRILTNVDPATWLTGYRSFCDTHRGTVTLANDGAETGSRLCYTPFSYLALSISRPGSLFVVSVVCGLWSVWLRSNRIFSRTSVHHRRSWALTTSSLRSYNEQGETHHKQVFQVVWFDSPAWQLVGLWYVPLFFVSTGLASAGI